MSSNKVIKSVSFNLTVKDDAAMLKHVKRKNFSGYVKKLILKDMNKEVVESVEEVEVEKIEIAVEQPKKETPQEKLDRLKAKKSESKPAPPKLLTPPKN